MRALASLTLITGNDHKSQSFITHLAFPLKHKKLDLIEIQSLDLHEVISHKAKEAYRILQSPIIVEDTSFIFNALGKLPGPFIKWFETLGNENLCRIVDAYEDRSAIVKNGIGLYDGEHLEIFIHETHGSIADNPQCEGFGWTPIFIPEGFDKTYAQLSLEERRVVSGRKKVIEQLNAFLR